jgi:hypothetical protein
MATCFALCKPDTVLFTREATCLGVRGKHRANPKPRKQPVVGVIAVTFSTFKTEKQMMSHIPICSSPPPETPTLHTTNWMEGGGMGRMTAELTEQVAACHSQMHPSLV